MTYGQGVHLLQVESAVGLHKLVWSRNVPHSQGLECLRHPGTASAAHVATPGTLALPRAVTDGTPVLEFAPSRILVECSLQVCTQVPLMRGQEKTSPPARGERPLSQHRG